MKISTNRRYQNAKKWKLKSTTCSCAGKLQFLVCPLFCPPVPSIELPSFFALVMPLYMPSTDNLKCPLYILPFFNGMPSLGMLHFQMCQHLLDPYCSPNDFSQVDNLNLLKLAPGGHSQRWPTPTSPPCSSLRPSGQFCLPPTARAVVSGPTQIIRSMLLLNR